MLDVRETAAPPWYLKQASFEGKIIAIIDNAPDGIHTEDDPYEGAYCVGWSELPLQPCYRIRCPDGLHIMVGGEDTYSGDSLEEAEAAYAELERKLLTGELSCSM